MARLLQSNPEDELLALITHTQSGYRTAGAQALAQKGTPSEKIWTEIVRLKDKDERPWARLGAWEAYELIQQRAERRKKVDELIKKIGGLISSGEFYRALHQIETEFNIFDLATDKQDAAYAKFQQARCAARLNRKALALDSLTTAFEYHPALRDVLRSEMAKKDNDWAILEDNWYLRDVLLKAPSKQN